MNKFVRQYIRRLEENDPTLDHVSLKRLPVFELSGKEIVAILKPLSANTYVKKLDFWLPASVDFGAITAILSDNKSIESVEITSCESNEGYEAVFRGLSSSGSIREIIIGGPSESSQEALSSLDATSSNYLANILRSGSLRRLSLKGLSLSEESAGAIGIGLEHSRLESIVLHQIESDPGSFGQMFESMVGIERVYIIDCDLDLEGPLDDHPFVSFLARNTSLRELRLLECALCENGLRQLQAIEEGMKLNQTLETLDLRNNLISDEGCAYLSGIFRRSSSLRKVILEDNRIGNKGIGLICHALAHNPYLKQLNLSSNTFTDCSALLNTSYIEKLDLSDTRISDSPGLALLFGSTVHMKAIKAEGCHLGTASLMKIFESLAVSSSLVSLNLGHNRMSTRAVKVLAQALRSNHSLKTLDLTSCSLGDAEIAYITRSLRKNSVLQELRLGFNKIGDAGCLHLGRNLPWMNIRSLELQFNVFSNDGLTFIVEGMEQNVSLTTFFALDYGIYDERKAFLIRRIGLLLRLNKGGRRILRDGCSTSVLPLILAKSTGPSSRDVIYYLLQSRPDIFSEVV